MQLTRTVAACLVLTALLQACSSHSNDHSDGASAPKAAGAARYDFQSAAPDALPAGFSEEVGRWRVVQTDGGGRALAQLAKNGEDVFNVVLAAEPKVKDLALRVRLRCVEGTIDQGGGPVWRARDAKNYYICRYNPLESNFRVYKVVDGKRMQLGSALVTPRDGWREIAVTCIGSEIRCSLDGAELLNVQDTTLGDAGRVGLWTKADAVTWFDDLSVEPR